MIMLKPLLFVLLLSNYLFADTLNLQQDWNLVGASSQMSLQELKDQIGDDNLLIIQGQTTVYKKEYVDDGTPLLNDFEGFQEGEGYWIKVANEIEIEFTPSAVHNQTISLTSRWNLINPTKDLTLDEIKAQVGADNLLVIQGSTTIYKKEYVDNGTPFANDFTQFEEPYGYWVKVQESSQLSFEDLNTPPTATPQKVRISTTSDANKSIILSGVDADGDALTYTIATQPAHGTLTPSGMDSNVTYTHDANYYGEDSFTFKVNDGTADSLPVTVDITVTSFLSTFKILKTGQTITFADFDDGYYEKGQVRSYVSWNFLTEVYDKTTGLLWQNDESIKTVTKTWEDAKTYCANLKVGDIRGRLPSLKELQTLPDFGRVYPSLDLDVWGNQGNPPSSRVYWSSTTYARDTNMAWVVRFWMGETKLNDKSKYNRVRCVWAGL